MLCCITDPVPLEDETADQKMQQARENAQQTFQLQVLTFVYVLN